MKFASLCALLVVGALLVSAATAETSREMEEVDYEFPERTSDRSADILRSQVSDRASLLLRALDVDHDKLISAADARAAPETLARFLPGVSAEEFASFIQLSDVDGDQKLSQQELNNGLAAGLKEVPEFIQLAEATDAKGVFGDIGNILGGMAGSVVNGAKAGFKGFVNQALGVNNGKAPVNNNPLTQPQFGSSQQQVQQQAPGIMQQIANRVNGRVDSSQDSCVICQYVVERAETNVKQAGVIPSMGAASPASFLEEKVEVKSQDPFDAVGSAIIGATRQSTRVQRQLERQKYNEIYRVVDITLDDVCEQGMPNAFYGYCKQIYQVQSDIVDGLRYQYRPTDICFRVGMCGPKSYITRGIHSRYK